ncbi:porin [Polaromonas sp.]|uniref:porin n=1 Tax=Polaromonas sp. TaxID=1869339 RepID=UPI003BB70325
MKKSFIALAVLAASGVASAQSSVTLYGIVDVWFGSTKTDTLVGNQAVGTRQTKVDSGGVDESRFGLKGSEDLGGGLKANFVLEQGFSLDTGTAGASNDYFGTKSAATTFSRQAYVGFSGGFGEAKIGKIATAYDDISGVTRPAFNSALSPDSNVWVSHSAYTWNPSNTLYYVTPSMSGFSAAASYSFGENKTAANDAGAVISANVTYTAGPVYAGLAYQVQESTHNDLAAEFTRLNGSYDFGVAKLLAGYGHVKNPGSVTGKVDEYEIGVDFPVSSALTLSGGYAHSKTTEVAGSSDTKRDGYSLAASYALSKRTYLYGGVQASKQKQDNMPDVKGDLYAVGIHHVF